MKTHLRSLLYASLVWWVPFLLIAIVAMLGGIGYDLYTDGGDVNPDVLIFIASTFFIVLASYAVYIIYFFFERKKAGEVSTKNLQFLPRVLLGLLAIVISGVVLFLCINWISDSGDDISILADNTALAGTIIGITAVIDMVNFIVFKPRL